jgi:hypothetical protein
MSVIRCSKQVVSRRGLPLLTTDVSKSECTSQYTGWASIRGKSRGERAW